jgi:uncharacterized protein (UPF0303 family)
MPDHESLVAMYREQEGNLVCARFDQADAWTLGRMMAEKAMAGGLGVAIEIRRPGSVLFAVSLPGASPDRMVWATKKGSVVLRLDKSSALAREEFGDFDPASIGWLSHEEFAVAGGSFPIRVKGVGLVAAVSVAGLSSEDDHALAVDTLREWLASPEARVLS